MAQQISKGNLWGRIGTGIGQGMAEQIPKELERYRLSSGLQSLSEQKGLSPLEQYAKVASVAHEYPQILQGASELARQQALIDNFNQGQQGANARSHGMPNQDKNQMMVPAREQKSGIPLASATTPQSTQAALNPYVSPSGKELEDMAQQRFVENPRLFRTIDEARQSVANEVSGDRQKSNDLITKGQLEKGVQNETEQALQSQISKLGADVPGTVQDNLTQQAVDAVASGKMSAAKAKEFFGRKADQASKVFNDIKGWGSLGLMLKGPKQIMSAMKATQKDAKEGGYQKEAADSMVADNGVTYPFAYAQMYPIKDISELNETYKNFRTSKESPKSNLNKAYKIAGGRVALGQSFINSPSSNERLEKFSPQLARSMGFEGSPLSIMYELEKDGYDPQIFKDYLINNMEKLNLTNNQRDELRKTNPGPFAFMNDWWLKSFSGVE